MSDDDEDPKRRLARLGFDPRRLARARGAEEQVPDGTPKRLFLSRQAPVAMSSDLTRVLNLERREPLDLRSPRAEALADMMTARYARAVPAGACPCGCGFACGCAAIDPKIATINPKTGRTRRRCLTRLKPVQAWVLYEIGIAGGVLAHVPVGGGKSLINILSALALHEFDPTIALALALVPPSLMQQLYRDARLIAEHMRVPRLIFQGMDKRVEPPDANILVHVLPYSRLSQPNSSDWVRNLGPDAIISDECFPGDTLVTTNEGDLPIREVVDGGRGQRALACELRTGRLVWRRIERRLRRDGSKPLVRITHERGQFVCTVDHKIWTRHGYVKAQELAPTDHLSVRLVRARLQTASDGETVLQPRVRDRSARPKDQRDERTQARRRSDGVQDMHSVPGVVPGPCVHERSGNVQSEVRQHLAPPRSARMRGMWGDVSPDQARRSLLLGAVSHEGTQAEREEGLSYRGGVSGLRRYVPDPAQRENDGTVLQPELRCQSCIDGPQEPGAVEAPAHKSVGIQCQPGSANAGSGQAQGAYFSGAGREWPADEATAPSAGRARTRRGSDGVRDLDEGGARLLPEHARLLQGRHRDLRSETSDRGRRQDTLDEEVEVSGSTQDGDLELSRVVSVAFLESGSARGDRTGGGRDPVYDLTVEGEHNYFADGVLVSNCDKLKNPDGAGSSRILRYFLERGDTRPVRFCGWTGSLTDSSITEFSHLSALALRELSPVPLDRNTISEWARAIDASDTPAPPGELRRLCDEERPDEDPSTVGGVRAAFGRRLAETMGFVVSTESSIEVDLTVAERAAPPLPAIVQEALHRARTCWVRPDTLIGEDQDEELTEASEVAKVCRELASGIFYRWRFPPIGGVLQRREVIKEWKEARRDFNRELRAFLQKREEWLDSPHLCELAAQRYHGDREKRDDRPEWASVTWPRWRDVKSLVKYEVEGCRVSDYLAADAAAWALQDLGIVWYGMVEFGQWVAELSGLPLHGGGPEAEARLIGGEHKGKMYRGEVGDRSIVASIKSHGRGRDGLQALFNRMLIAQPPSSATQFEQVLGRLERDGQQAPEVVADYYAHTPELAAAIDTAVLRAQYVQGTLKQTQKLLRGGGG